VICCSIGNWKIAIYHRFVVGGYVRKCVELRISYRVESCCIGIRDRASEFRGFIQVIFIAFITISPLPLRLLRRSGHPISSWYQIPSVSSVSIHKSIHRFVFVFILSTKKPKKYIRVRVCHSLDCIFFKFLVAGRVSLIRSAS